MSNDAMKPEIVHGDWIVVDGVYGVSVYPSEHMDQGEALADYLGTDRLAENINKVDECEIVKGWAARLSMLGFLDATDWQGPYDTEREALSDLETLYCED